MKNSIAPDADRRGPIRSNWPWIVAVVLFAVTFLVTRGGMASGDARAENTGRVSAQSTSPSQIKQPAERGLSYQTVIPRPTAKGYYEPRVVPYPVGKPLTSAATHGGTGRMSGRIFDLCPSDIERRISRGH
jgi:hypothetical protein